MSFLYKKCLHFLWLESLKKIFRSVEDLKTVIRPKECVKDLTKVFMIVEELMNFLGI